jgi:hypothetical protein
MMHFFKKLTYRNTYFETIEVGFPTKLNLKATFFGSKTTIKHDKD